MECSGVSSKMELKNSAGQALMEFTLGLLIIISFFFFYIRLASVFALGNFIHYATFMSARAYSVGHTSEDIQIEAAELVLQKMISNRWASLLKPEEGSSQVKGATIGLGEIAQSNPAEYWNEGVTYSFTADLSFYPFQQTGQSLKFKLTSESWTKREEPAMICAEKRNKIASRLASTARLTNLKVHWENGNESFASCL